MQPAGKGRKVNTHVNVDNGEWTRFAKHTQKNPEVQSNVVG